MNFALGGGARFEAGFVDAVLNVERHRLGWCFEDGRLVHVVPEAGHAVVIELLVERSPPFAGGFAGEIGKDGGTGPDDAYVFAAVGILDEVVAFLAAVVRRVIGVGEFGDVQVGDGDDVEMFRF